jgi:formylglycine-generating enzyme required for sulfatase activity
MIQLKAGTFTMGQLEIETPTHSVTLTHDFCLGKHEVTNEAFRTALQWAYNRGLVEVSTWKVSAYDVVLLDINSSSCRFFFSNDTFSLAPYDRGKYNGQSIADHPVMSNDNITWYGAACYCDWLSLLEGLTPYYNGIWHQTPAHNPYEAEGYRLPTEAEWEYAAKYDDGRTYPWGNAEPSCALSNFASCNDGWTSPVGSYPLGASKLGLMDMAGNVWEWVGDRYGDYSIDPQTDPLGSSRNSSVVRRGGCSIRGTQYLFSASRSWDRPDPIEQLVGFRLCSSGTFLSGKRTITVEHTTKASDSAISKKPHIEMIRVPAGAFTMGQKAYELEHEVTLTNDYYLGLHEVTNQEYLEAVQWAYNNDLVEIVTRNYGRTRFIEAYGEMLLDFSGNSGVVYNYNTRRFWIPPPIVGGDNTADHPVTRVTWYGAACFCDWLSIQEGLEPFYKGNWDQTPAHNPYEAVGYRLPTEAEWEYAAQYDDDRIYPWGDTNPNCNLQRYHYDFSSPVGSYPVDTSKLGLMDMAGNVWEWVGDWYGLDYYGRSPLFDPLGPADGKKRVNRSGRGGSLKTLRCADRGKSGPLSNSYKYGFRICRRANQSSFHPGQ